LRYYPLFAATYGATVKDVESHLVSVDIFGQKIRFNQRNNAAQALQRVMQELGSQETTRIYMENLKISNRSLAGGYNWRTIAGTQELSMHSYGIAIDLIDNASPDPQYWRWLDKKDPEKALKNVKQIAMLPWEVITTFEQNGFIWGGKWHHFDTMHFEYRPELTLKSACRHSLKQRK
jgi:hypothetical protein